MNAHLEERRQQGSSPFDGRILEVLCKSPSGMRAGLLGIVDVLINENANPSILHTLLDWHQHDGYLTNDDVVDWEELIGALSDDARLVQWSSDDTFVRRAWYPPDFSWLLRWCISSDPSDFGTASSPAVGSYDITASAELISAARSVAPDAEIRDATEFYSATWAG